MLCLIDYLLCASALISYPGIAKTFDYKNFHDDSWWEVADDYGTSLYTELTMLINEKEDKRKVKELVASRISDWSSHNGRRNLRVLSDFSNHGDGSSQHGRLFNTLGGFAREGSIGKLFSSHGDTDKDKEREKIRESEISDVSGVENWNVGFGSRKNALLTKIVERDIENQDFIPEN